MSAVDDMQLFARVVEHGSFTRTADELTLSRSLVSKRVSDLERRLGVRLLNRTTRQLSLTEYGESYYGYAVQVRDTISEAERSLGDLGGAPQGRLRVSMPVAFGEIFLAPMLQDFLERFPGIHVELDLSDNYVDLVEHGYDVAIRIGELPDSQMIARRLARTPLTVCAAHSYLARHGAPEHPEDLSAHNCVTYRLKRNHADAWEFCIDGAPRHVAVSGNLRCGSGNAVRSATLAGVGLAQLPRFMVADDLASDRLVELLAAYTGVELDIHAVYPQPRQIPPKVRVFIDYLLERLQVMKACC